MSDKDIETFLMISEPAFDVGDKQYSVCCVNRTFCTWDSNDNLYDFENVSDLLDLWMIDGQPFRRVVESVMQSYHFSEDSGFSSL